MARPRSFDAEVVLDKAVEVFRSKGYVTTSIEDLEQATGLRRASLYGAFKDKHSLYVAALKRYDATKVTRMLAELDAAPTGRRALERLFEIVLEQSGSDPNGCLIANAAVERGREDVQAARCIEDNRRRIEGALQAAVKRGRKDGSLAGGGDAAATARYLFSVVLGLRGLLKAGCTCAQLKEVVVLALKTV